MNTHANTLLCSPDFGLEKQAKILYQEQTLEQVSAVLVLASGSGLAGVVVGDSLFGVTSSANAIVKAVRRAYNNTNVVLAVDTFKNFQASETVKKSTSTGTQ